jgi:hypothetical protein
VISGDAKAVSENIGGLVNDAKTAVSDARSTIAEVGKLADEGTKSTRSIKGMLEELKAFYELVRHWLDLSATTPSESAKDAPQQRDASAAETVTAPPDGYFRRAWAWLHSLWSTPSKEQK